VQPTSTGREPTTLHDTFTTYLRVCNTAMDLHRDEFPFKQLIEIGDKLASNRRFGVGIYKDDPASPHAYYTIEVNAGRLEIVARGKQPDTSMDWKVKQSYVEHVAADPTPYVEHPMKLDWDWVKSRLQ
jgi:hypothetical protein